GFIATLQTDETLGGRFSALSASGLVPAGLAGAHVRGIVDESAAVATDFGADGLVNTALRFRCWLSIGNARTTDKLVLTETDAGLRGIAAWIEQLIAESLGKDGQGILPVVVDSPADIGFSDARADALLCVLGPAPDDSGLGAPSGFEATVSGGLGELFLFWEY